MERTSARFECGFSHYKKERRNFVKYFKAEVGNGDLVHKNIKNSLEEECFNSGTMMLIAGSLL